MPERCVRPGQRAHHRDLDTAAGRLPVAGRVGRRSTVGGGDGLPVVSIWTTGWMLNAPPAAARRRAWNRPQHWNRARCLRIRPQGHCWPPTLLPTRSRPERPRTRPERPRTKPQAPRRCWIHHPCSWRHRRPGSKRLQPLLPAHYYASTDDARATSENSVQTRQCRESASPTCREPNKQRRDLGYPALARDQIASAAIRV